MKTFARCCVLMMALTFTTAVFGQNTRAKLTADLVRYVSTVGNDANDCSASDPQHACLTIQSAFDKASNTWDLGQFNITIQVADGTYTQTTVLRPYLATTGTVIIKGNASIPSNVSIETSGYCFNAVGNRHSPVQVQDMKLKSTGSWCLAAEVFGGINFQNLVFDASGVGHIYSLYGSYIEMKGDYSVIGGAAYHVFVGDQAQAFIALHTISYFNNPVFSGANFNVGILSELQCAFLTFVNGNTVTGRRYSVFGNGVLQTNGGGPNYIPGNLPGIVGTGGQYF